MSASNKEETAFKLGILIFDEVEVLDYCGPFEVFSVAGNLQAGTFTKVIIIAENKMISTRGGMQVMAEHVIDVDSLPELDIILVPGGLGARKLAENKNVLNWIKKLEPSLKYIISVCTGAAILGKCGLVDNMTITTHHSGYDFVGAACLNSRICKCRRFIDSGRVLTSAGISAGIDLSLYFVKKLFGNGLAEKVAAHMEYNWKDKEFGTCVCGVD